MRLKKVVSLVGFIFVAMNALAQHKLSGNLKDSQQENLAGVSIYIADLKIGTLTDPDGNYQFARLKAGTYLLEISLAGYKSIVKQVNITADTVINFILADAINELNEVIITGVSRSTELKLSPMVVKTLDKSTLIQSSSTNLIDGLRNIPGVSQITVGTAISKPVIRGLGYNRIITLNDGIRQEGQQWGDEHGIEMDKYAVDRVEIVKGPGSLMYGSDGIAGVLNFVAPQPPSIGKISTQLISSYHSNHNLISYSLLNAGNKYGIQWLGRISNQYAGNYQNTYDGPVLNSGFRELDGSLFLGTAKSWGHSHLTVSSYNNALNLPEGERDSLGRFTYVDSDGKRITATASDYSGYKIGFPHQEVTHFRIASNNYFILKAGTVNADIGFQHNQRKEFGDPTKPNEAALFFDLNTLSYNVRYNKAAKGWETSIGIGGMQQHNINRGVEFLIPAYNFFDVGFFMFSQKTFKQLTFAGGLRLDNRHINASELYLDSLEQPVSVPDTNSLLKFSPFTQNYGGISGSWGVSYQASSTSTLKCNVSRGFRVPTIAELASNGRHEGTFRYEIGNPNLKPEISHQIDIAYFLNAEHITVEFTPFVNLINHYIFAEKLTGAGGQDSIPDPADPAPAFRFSSGHATLLGGEIYFDIHPHPLDWLHLENSFSYVQATQQNMPDSSTYLPFTPAPKYSGEIKAQFKTIGKALSAGYLKFRIDYFWAQHNFFSAHNTETATPAYTLLSAGIGTYIKGFKRKDFITLCLNAENLANIAYQNHLSRLKYAPKNWATGRTGIFNMGRNISIMLVINL